MILSHRLWLSSSPTPQFPISILQAGIKMTTEPPKGLKANMKRLYGLITETQFDSCQEKSKYKKLLFTLVFFHSILLERKKFRQLGWNVVYSFNDSDFEVPILPRKITAGIRCRRVFPYLAIYLARQCLAGIQANASDKTAQTRLGRVDVR